MTCKYLMKSASAHDERACYQPMSNARSLTCAIRNKHVFTACKVKVRLNIFWAGIAKVMWNVGISEVECEKGRNRSNNALFLAFSNPSSG